MQKYEDDTQKCWCKMHNKIKTANIEWCGARVGGPKSLNLLQVLKWYRSCMKVILCPQIRLPISNSAPKLTAGESSTMNGDDSPGN